jgi:phosphopantetheinyl transferase
MTDTAFSGLKVYAARVPGDVLQGETGACPVQSGPEALSSKNDAVVRMTAKQQAEAVRKVRDALLLHCYREVRPGAPLPAAAPGPHGKPYFPEDLSFRFSISHSGTHAAVAFAQDPSLTFSVGLDIQELRRIPGDCLKVAKRFFAPDEYEALRSIPDGERRALFCRMWAAKEAFLKMTGEGLPGDPASFSVLSEGTLTARIVRGETEGFLYELPLFSSGCSAAVCCNVPVKSVQSVLVPEETLFPA